jgi:hypothetical protein
VSGGGGTDATPCGLTRGSLRVPRSFMAESGTDDSDSAERGSRTLLAELDADDSFAPNTPPQDCSPLGADCGECSSAQNFC